MAARAADTEDLLTRAGGSSRIEHAKTAKNPPGE
jgi:hypothetical protein